MFGAVNSLFSALAFVALVAAILLQREELEHQREELELTRGEIKGQKEQLEGQRRQMEIQNFENRFFQMVRLWNELLNDVRLRYVSVTYTGREAFLPLATSLYKYYRGAREQNEAEDMSAWVNTAIHETYKGESASLPVYMGTLYRILKLVDETDLTFPEKKNYTSILRSQLSKDELTLIFYNCLSDRGNVKFQPLIEKYGMFKHLEESGHIDPALRDLYDPKAFE
jgi:hypothetical protein